MLIGRKFEPRSKCTKVVRGGSFAPAGTLLAEFILHSTPRPLCALANGSLALCDKEGGGRYPAPIL